jgi:hypothetical protein
MGTIEVLVLIAVVLFVALHVGLWATRNRKG